MTENNVNVKCNGRVANLINKKFAEVVTTAEDRTGKKYETSHNLKLSKANPVEVGDYVNIVGKLESINGLNWIEGTYSKLDTEPSDQNMYAWIEGEAPASFFEPKSLDDEFGTKRPFGIATVKIDEHRRQRGIVFNTLIAKMRENLKAGAIVRLAGRLQYRTYQHKETGRDMTVAEIICNNEYTKVLKLSQRVNPFAFDAEEPDMSAFGKATE